MEVAKFSGSDLGFFQKKMMDSSVAEAVVFETILVAQRSIACLLMMTGFLLKDTDPLLGFTENGQRFPFSELRRTENTEPEAKDGSDTEDDDEEDAEEPDDDAGDEDFSGDEGGDDDDDEADPDEDHEANGNQDSDDEDDDDGQDDDDDDDEEEEDDDDDDDEEEQPPAKKRK